uniref:YTH domain-containing protein n=1 Tax=Steinernema glaseri TaxID=37863 RepID=A0A1I7ZX99_9BILA
MMQDLEQTTVAKDSLDMFADDDEPGPSSSAQANQPDSTVDEEVHWEYRLIDDDEAKIHGPFTTTAISKLKDTNDEVAQGFARRVGSEAFYKVARIDFDLYE